MPWAFFFAWRAQRREPQVFSRRERCRFMGETRGLRRWARPDQVTVTTNVVVAELLSASVTVTVIVDVPAATKLSVCRSPWNELDGRAPTVTTLVLLEVIE